MVRHLLPGQLVEDLACHGPQLLVQEGLARCLPFRPHRGIGVEFAGVVDQAQAGDGRRARSGRSPC